MKQLDYDIITLLNEYIIIYFDYLFLHYRLLIFIVLIPNFVPFVLTLLFH